MNPDKIRAELEAAHRAVAETDKYQVAQAIGTDVG